MGNPETSKTGPLRVRVYCHADRGQVLDLFRDGTMTVPGGPYRGAMDGQPFHPYARACYVVFVAGLLLAIVTGWRYSWVGGALSIGSMYKFWKNRRGIRLGFEGYVQEGLDGDLNDVPASYDLRENGQGDFICDTAKGFWVVVVDTPQPACGQNNEIIVGTIGLDCGPTKSSGLLRRMVVAPGYQRRGIGAYLLEIAIAHARSHGTTSLHLTTSEWNHAVLSMSHASNNDSAFVTWSLDFCNPKTAWAGGIAIIHTAMGADVSEKTKWLERETRLKQIQDKFNSSPFYTTAMTNDSEIGPLHAPSRSPRARSDPQTRTLLCGSIWLLAPEYDPPPHVLRESKFEPSVLATSQAKRLLNAAYSSAARWAYRDDGPAPCLGID
ncbi:hypothetical protein BD779DRAFT_1785817, partial [Infundibulicybe gibba]